MKFVDIIDLRTIETWLRDEDGARVCKCKICFGNNSWSISEWFTASGYQNQGYGNKTMKHAVQTLLEKTGTPNEIRYIWNGANEYVYQWLTKHFSPTTLMPIEVQKTSSDDDWSNHIYILDKNKFLQYFTED